MTSPTGKKSHKRIKHRHTDITTHSNNSIAYSNNNVASVSSSPFETDTSTTNATTGTNSLSATGIRKRKGITSDKAYETVHNDVSHHAITACYNNVSNCDDSNNYNNNKSSPEDSTSTYNNNTVFNDISPVTNTERSNTQDNDYTIHTDSTKPTSLLDLLSVAADMILNDNINRTNNEQNYNHNNNNSNSNHNNNNNNTYDDSPTVAIGVEATTPQKGAYGTVLGMERNTSVKKIKLDAAFSAVKHAKSTKHSNSNSNNINDNNTNNDNGPLIDKPKHGDAGRIILANYNEHVRPLNFHQGFFNLFFRSEKQTVLSPKRGFKPFLLTVVDNNDTPLKPDRTNNSCGSIYKDLRIYYSNHQEINYPFKTDDDDTTKTARQQSVINNKITTNCFLDDHGNYKMPLNIITSLSIRQLLPEDFHNLQKGQPITIFFTNENGLDPGYFNMLYEAWGKTKQFTYLTNVTHNSIEYYQLHGHVKSNPSNAINLHKKLHKNIIFHCFSKNRISMDSISIYQHTGMMEYQCIIS